MDFFDNSSFNPNESINAGGGNKQGGDADRQNNLVHVTASQIAKYTTQENGMVIHNQKAKTIACVGFVESVEELNTRNTYMLRDYTLDVPIEIQLWKNDPSDPSYQAMPAVMEKTYIRVIGQPKYDEKRPYVIAYRIIPIQDPIEVEEHLMESIADAVILEKRHNDEGMNSSDSTVTNNFAPNNDPSDIVGSSAGFNDVQKMILKVISKYGNSDVCQNGIRREEIKQRLTGLNPDMVDKGIDFLSQEGHIFSTIDEDTFQTAECS